MGLQADQSIDFDPSQSFIANYKRLLRANRTAPRKRSTWKCKPYRIRDATSGQFRGQHWIRRGKNAAYTPYWLAYGPIRHARDAGRNRKQLIATEFSGCVPKKAEVCSSWGDHITLVSLIPNWWPDLWSWGRKRSSLLASQIRKALTWRIQKEQTWSLL